MTTDTGEPEGRRRDIPGDTFAARLVLVRHHAGRLSIEQAALRAGINAEAWRRWEDGARPRDQIEAATAIAETHGIDRDWLMFGGALTPAARPPKRSSQVTGRYPNLTHQSLPGNRLITVDRPKGRTDSHAPLASGRRAALVR